MIRNKTVAELEELGLQVFVNYRTNGYGEQYNVVAPPKADKSPEAKEPDTAKTDKAEKPPVAKTKTKPPKFPTKDELLVAIRGEMVRISKKTSKLEALAEVKKLGYDKLSKIPGSELADVLAALKEVE